jgi:hypothetical protein
VLPPAVEHEHEEPAMNEIPTRGADLQELASRENDGLQVKLFWDERHDHLRVSVVDTKKGESFDLDAARDKALDVFHHPCSHATSRFREDWRRGIRAGHESEHGSGARAG